LYAASAPFFVIFLALSPGIWFVKESIKTIKTHQKPMKSTCLKILQNVTLGVTFLISSLFVDCAALLVMLGYIVVIVWSLPVGAAVLWSSLVADIHDAVGGRVLELLVLCHSSLPMAVILTPCLGWSAWKPSRFGSWREVFVSAEWQWSNPWLRVPKLIVVVITWLVLLLLKPLGQSMMTVAQSMLGAEGRRNHRQRRQLAAMVLVWVVSAFSGPLEWMIGLLMGPSHAIGNLFAGRRSGTWQEQSRAVRRRRMLGWLLGGILSPLLLSVALLTVVLSGVMSSLGLAYFSVVAVSRPDL
jgi:hypothetical protein